MKLKLSKMPVELMYNTFIKFTILIVKYNLEDYLGHSIMSDLHKNIYYIYMALIIIIFRFCSHHIFPKLHLLKYLLLLLLLLL